MFWRSSLPERQAWSVVLRIVSMALSITTIGVTQAMATASRRTPAPSVYSWITTSLLLALLEWDERLKCRGSTTQRRGGGGHKKCLRPPAHTPEVEKVVSNTPTRSRTKLSSGAAALFCVRLVHKRVLRSLSRSSLRLLLGGHDYIQVSNRKRPHQQHQVGARRGNLHHHLHPRACRPARPSGRRGRRRRSPAPRVCHWKGPRPLLCPCKPKGGSGGRGGGLQQRGARLSQSPPPHLPFQIMSFYS